MNKTQIRELCKRMFEAGKNNFPSYSFEELFEEIWGEYQ